MNDETGAWWKGSFGATYTIKKVKILNRGDCCGGRLKGSKIFIGDELFGTLDDPAQGQWTVVRGAVNGNFIKI